MKFIKQTALMLTISVFPFSIQAVEDGTLKTSGIRAKVKVEVTEITDGTRAKQSTKVKLEKEMPSPSGDLSWLINAFIRHTFSWPF